MPSNNLVSYLINEVLDSIICIFCEENILYNRKFSEEKLEIHVHSSSQH